MTPLLRARLFINFGSQNPIHPSLNVELLEPRQHSVYSFRIDRKYRALFIYRPDQNGIEVIAIARHYA